MANPKRNRFRSPAPPSPGRSRPKGRRPASAFAAGTPSDEARAASDRQSLAARASGYRDASAPPWWAMVAMGSTAYDDEAFASTSGIQKPRDDWGYFAARRLRYDVFWGHYEGNVFGCVHRWAESLKQDRGLYEYIRTIYSPAYRIVEFWAGHVWGGSLDYEAGDGVERPNCLPIEGATPRLQQAISTLLIESNWQAKKDTVTRFGAAKGDVAIAVQDDALGMAVSLRVVDPWTIADLRRDGRGNVREYVIQEWRPDPRLDDLGPFGRRFCTYTEWCRKVGDSVVTTTYLDGAEYDWRDYPDGTPDSEFVGPTWMEPYDFVPLVLIQHRDMGLGWGWSELQPDFGKMYEVDDLASKLSDQIRKIVECPLYISGSQPEDVQVDRTEDGREVTATLYGPEGSKPEYLVANLDIKAASDHIRTILDDIEKDHPELAADNVGLAASGEARKVAREKVEAMVVQRRAGYDDGFARAVKMAISIGGIKGYPGYEGFDEGSYDRGDLDFSVGSRPVFAVDEVERIAESQARANAAKTWVDAGFPEDFALRQCGASEDEVEAALESIARAKDDAVARDVRRQSGLMAAGFAPDPGPDPGLPSPDGNLLEERPPGEVP